MPRGTVCGSVYGISRTLFFSATPIISLSGALCFLAHRKKKLRFPMNSNDLYVIFFWQNSRTTVPPATGALFFLAKCRKASFSIVFRRFFGNYVKYQFRPPHTFPTDWPNNKKYWFSNGFPWFCSHPQQETPQRLVFFPCQ